MLSAWAIALALGAAWVELTSGLPPYDDFTTASFGDDPDEIWLGTKGGRVWMSHDGGESWALVFRPRANEPVVEPRLRNIRVSTVGDLGRGLDHDLDPRDRTSRIQESADLAGGVRDQPRTRGSPLLSSLLRPTARDRIEIAYINHCLEATYLVTPEALWRSYDRGVRWDRLFVGPAGPASEVHWLTCDATQPGRIALNTGAGVLESVDWGDSFFPYRNPFPRAMLPQTASLGPGGRLLILDGNMVFRERQDRRGYDRICHLVGDSVEAEQVRWAWWVSHSRMTFGVTNDGVIRCYKGKSERLPDARLARQIARFVWIDWTQPGHMYAATQRQVLESFDDGMTMKEVFVVPTLRSIRRVLFHEDRPMDLLVLTAGQVFRRITDETKLRAGPGEPSAYVRRQAASAPLWDVVLTGLTRLELTPQAIASRRDNITLRGLLPTVVVRFVRIENRFADGSIDRAVQTLASGGTSRAGDFGGNVWGAFALWDLADLWHDPEQTNTSWVDVERLRAKITYRIQDYYAMWMREIQALDNPRLSLSQRVFHEVARREAAAYLHQITGGSFAAFDMQGGTPPATRSLRP
ncbi:MAG: hypothetical protein V3T05_08625 [Myxococcota bacterium]